ncbi:serine/threonine-protein kinase [Lentzea flaviverrucosa]|uniref:non-specific serine/threonine protein kinase n=1 Tax=Lentzea flaviverrucosa TaxID=200379 RepID=A0A1H9XW82_9PSEU|nr:serine/threonine-protein kinase [Lentzea flaviverrucosa]RDI34428.1 serine/threonine protein kinase [Lentzea flaviverrucosa]SES50401.1 Serine/threonine protein kinase [Lentzea flaviverrucosa]
MSVSAQDRLLSGRYEVGELLGAGGMADVYRAWDTRLRRHVAVKLFRPGSDTADDKRFENEIRTLASLSHPGLVHVHDAATDDDSPFVVLQLVEGRTLRDRIVDGPLPVEEGRRLGAELADALAYVHAHGVVHRDIKPSNVLLDHHDRPHLADFGLARLIGATRLTRADQLVGTAAYLAPEQVRGEEIHHAVDIYALGLVLLECLTGQREYQGSEIEAAVARLHRQPAIPDELPEDLRRLLTLMTSLSPRRRPTAAQCAHALQHPDEVPTVVGSPVRPGRPVRLLAASAVLVALTTAGITTVLLNQAPPAESAPPASTSAEPPASTTTSVPAVSTPQPTMAPVVVPAQAEPLPRDAEDDKGKHKSGKDKEEKPDKGKGKGKAGKG